MMTDFEKVDLMNYLVENKDATSRKAIIMMKTVS